MPNAVGVNFGITFLIAGVLFLVVMFIFLRRYRQIRLRITLLRGTVPLLFALICFSAAFAIFEDRPEYALSWYRLIIITILWTESTNLIFLTFVVFGRLHATTGTLNMIFVGINLFLVYTEENLHVQLSPELMAYYPVLSVVFFGTNIIYGAFHTGYDVWANLKILRRPGLTTPMKLKFLLFTAGIATMFLTFAGTCLSIILWNTGIFYFWGIVGCCASLVETFFGLFYVNPSVFYLPIRLYMLVVFTVADPGAIIYEKRFNPIHSSSLNLLGPGVASIADLVQKSFKQSKRLNLFSLPGRKLLYEWGGGMGAVLIADQETNVYRNCLRVVLKDAPTLPTDPEKFDARVMEIFEFYTNERMV